MTDEIQEKIREILGKDHNCYILVTCSPPSSEGSLQVEMLYEGDPVLASYLLEDAHRIMQEDLQEQI